MPDAPISKEEKHARNRAKLTAAAQTVLLRQGYAKSSLRDIATEADVSLGTLHYYFKDKSELMTSAFRAHQAAFIQGIHTVAESKGTPEERCRNMAQSWVRQVIENGRTYRIWYDLRNQALFEPELRPVTQEMERLMVAAVVALTGAGDASPQLIKRISDHFVPMLGGLFHHALQRITFGDTIDPGLLEEGFASVLLRILAEMTVAPEL